MHVSAFAFPHGPVMNKFIAVIFPGESQACEGAKAIEDLRDEDNLFVYGMAVAARDQTASCQSRTRPKKEQERARTMNSTCRPG